MDFKCYSIPFSPRLHSLGKPTPCDPGVLSTKIASLLVYSLLPQQRVLTRADCKFKLVHDEFIELPISAALAKRITSKTPSSNRIVFKDPNDPKGRPVGDKVSPAAFLNLLEHDHCNIKDFPSSLDHRIRECACIQDVVIGNRKRPNRYRFHSLKEFSRNLGFAK